MHRSSIVRGILLLTVSLTACHGDDHTNTNTNSNPCNHDGNCEVSRGESAINCPDCPTACDLRIPGTDHDFLVEAVRLSPGSESAEHPGVDIDGDGAIDNQLGGILSQLGLDATRLEARLNGQIASGVRLHLIRLRADGFPTDPEVFVQLLEGVIPVGGASPLFDGQDELALRPGYPDDQYLCGSVTAGELFAGPANLNIVLDTQGAGLTSLIVERLEALTGPGATAGTVIQGLVVGGAVTPATFDAGVTPILANLVNSLIADDPDSGWSRSLLERFDGCPAIEPDGPCASMTPGVGSCASDGLLSADELRCDPPFRAASEPTVDVDGDGELDLVTFGLEVVQAMPVTVVP